MFSPYFSAFSLCGLLVFTSTVFGQVIQLELPGFPIRGRALPGIVPPQAVQDEAAPPADPIIVAPSSDPRAAEIRLTDGGALRVNLLDENLEFVTPYGKLLVPVMKVRRLDLAARVPEEIRKKVAGLVADLGSTEFAEREAATKTLLELGVAAYPVLMQQKRKAEKDPEIQGRMEQVLEQIREQVPEEQREPRVDDVLETVDAKFTGQLVSSSFKAESAQFGTQDLKLSDLRTLRRLNVAGDVEAIVGKVEADPGNMTMYREQIGKTFQFRVTGAATGSVWGTGIFTTDSSLATAAVHSGLLKVGQTGVLKVSIVPSPAGFTGSTKNGISTYDYGPYPSAYKIRK